MNEYSLLYNNIRYIAPYDYLINHNIIEFDLEKANISALYEEKFFTKDQYDYYYNLSKKEREINIGNLIKSDANIYNIIQQGIINAKHMFFQFNNIYDENILYIDNDSITLLYPININKQFITKFSEIYNFKCKNIYTSFLRLYGIDFLYYNNGYKESYRLKNCNQELIIFKHKNYFLDLLLTILYSRQFDAINNTINLIHDMYIQYVNKLFPIMYYREFNNRCQYKIISRSKVMTYYIDDIPNQYYINDIDIYYNASIIQLIYRYFIKQYFQSYK